MWTSGRKRKAQPGRGRTRKNTRARETEQDGQEQAHTRDTPPHLSSDRLPGLCPVCLPSVTVVWGGPPLPSPPPRTPQSPKEWGGGKVKWCTIRWVATSRTSARLLRPFGVALQGHPQTALNSAGVQTFWGGPCRVPPQRASPEGTPFGFTPVPQKDEPCNQAETVRQKAQLRSATQESSTTRC